MNIAEEVIEKFGGQSKLAALIGKGQSTVAYWAKAGTIPTKWQPKLLELAASQNIDLTPSAFIPRKAMETSESDEPKKVFAKHAGELRFGGEAKVDCYVLSTGQRVLSMSGTVLAIAKVDSGNVGNIVGIDALKSLIDKDRFAGEIIAFDIPGNPTEGKGVTAESFLELCSAYVTALQQDLLRTDKQRENAIRCSVLLASCAKVGLVALIDEATGYQYEREDDALRVKLKAFIADELRAWEKTFPDELWEEFGRLTGWQGSLHSRPKWWGKLVIELIYETLDPDVAAYLRTNKPPSGVRWFQQLTENYGVRQLVSRCFEIIGMAKTCDTMIELREKVAHHYGKEPVQITLYLPIKGGTTSSAP